MNATQPTLALLALSLVASPAAAATPRDAGIVSARYVAAPEFTGGDWVASFLLADAGLFVGAVAGGAAGYALAGGCVEDDASDGQLFGRCAFHGLNEAALGAVILAPLSSAAAVTIYGNARGHRGSYWAALGGSYGGSLLAGLVIAANGELEDSPLGWVAVATLPALGSVFGYYLSRDTSDRLVPVSGALLDVGADGVVRLSVPNVGVSLGGASGADDTTVTVSLLGGAL